MKTAGRLASLLLFVLLSVTRGGASRREKDAVLAAG
jgi:hypothetical protein